MTIAPEPLTGLDTLRELAEKGARAMKEGADAAGWTPSDAEAWTEEASPEVVLALCDVAEAAAAHVEHRRTREGVTQWPRLLEALARLSAATSK